MLKLFCLRLIFPHKFQVHQGYDGSPGAIVLQQRPLMVLGGDAFIKSGFDGCIDSALKISEIVSGN